MKLCYICINIYESIKNLSIDEDGIYYVKYNGGSNHTIKIIEIQ